MMPLVLSLWRHFALVFIKQHAGSMVVPRVVDFADSSKGQPRSESDPRGG